MNIDDFVEEFAKQIVKKKIVVFTGAGMSTASGIKDFRGENGLYKENIDAEEMLSLKYFVEHPKEFYEFYRKNLLISDNIKPNIAHELIKYYQDKGYIDSIITQNIDGLDKKVGLKNVIELHGNASKFYCTKCHKKYTVDQIKNMDIVPICDECKSIIRPDIVLYTEKLEISNLWFAKQYISSANTLLVIGSSLKVNPAASMVHDFIVDARHNKNKELFIINKGKTDFDGFKNINRYDGDIIDVVKTLSKKLTI
jgi:NAD-dependent deacetylase